MLLPIFFPYLGGPFSTSVNWVVNRSVAVGYGASLLKVFWPYLDWNTVFDNSRVVAELGEAPAKFSAYAAPLLKYCRENKSQFPAKPWPETGICSPGNISEAGPRTPKISGALRDRQSTRPNSTD